MKKIIFIWMLIVLSALAQSVVDKNYFPLKEGNQWEYISPDVERFEDLEVNTIQGNKIVTITKMYYGGLNIPPITEILMYKDNKLFVFASGGGLLESPIKEHFSMPIKLKFPLSVGQQWEYEDISERTLELEVLKKHALITTPYGTFKNVVEIQEKIIDGDRILYSYYYYAYNIGLVKREIQTEKGRQDWLYLKTFQNVSQH